MTHLDDAHAALMRAVASEAPESYAFLPREQAEALLDEAARLVAERDALIRERDEARDRLAGIEVGAQTGCCGICWTTSWAPCPPDDPNAHHDEDGSYLCQHCVLTAAFARAEAERDRALRLLDQAVAVIHGEFCHAEDRHHPTCAHFRGPGVDGDPVRKR